jgi:peptidoglycan hydrolase CwlO-like protein
MTWEVVTLILGITVIIVGGFIKIFGKDLNRSSSILPKKFYDVEKQVTETSLKFGNFKEHIDEKIEDIQEDIKETNKKIDKLTELLIEFIKKT